MKKMFISCAVIAALALSGAVAAGTAVAKGQKTTSGVYVGANLGYGGVDYNVVGASNDKDGFAGSANAGYQFNQNLALEGGYSQFSETKSGGAVVSDDNRYGYVAVKGILPFANGLNLSGKLGAALVHSTIKAGFTGAGTYNEVAPYVGVGVGYAIAPNVELNLHSDVTTKTDNIAGMYKSTVGVAYHFS